MSQNGNNAVSSEGKNSNGDQQSNLENEQEEQNDNNTQQENEQNPSENINSGNQDTQSQNKALEKNDYDYEQNRKEIMEKIEIRKQQADLVEKYIAETGISTSFQIIFSELISKKIPVEKYFEYTASRLRQIGREKEALDRKYNKNK